MSFFSRYFEYVGESEAPTIYHRWTAISMMGALLGRQAWIPFGHGVIYPNMYIMLMGTPGARKGTAMNIGSKLLRDAGYTRFCADRLSKEQFLREMRPYDDIDFSQDPDLESLTLSAAMEVYAFAEEFTDLVGQNNMEFLTMLTKLWDNPPEYKHPKIHGKDVIVEKPTVNLYGGNTAQGLSLAIPPESINNGFTSRMLFIHSDPTGKKITFPAPRNLELKEFIVGELKAIRETITGEVEFSDGAKHVLDKCYKKYIEVDDPRFRYYNTRRFTHLLKLCLNLSAMEQQKIISEQTAILANTILYAAEKRMPKALGEFGKSKFSDTANTVIDILTATIRPLSLNDLFKKVSRDISDIKDLAAILKNLVVAERVQVITDKSGKQGFMTRNITEREWDPSLIDMSLLTMEEQ